MRKALLFAAVALVAACQAEPRGAVAAPAGSSGSVETRDPVGQGAHPAFAGQTRAPAVATKAAYTVERVAGGLSHPWSLAFLPDGRMLVTERPGRLRILGRDGAKSEPVQGLPPVDARSQGGLLDVVLAPDFARSGMIYWSYAEPREGGNGTAVARGRLVDGPQPRVEGVQVIFRQMPTFESAAHFGGRLVWARDGTLFVTLGERSALGGRRQAQDLGSHLGKIVRINADGSVPADNPFVGRAGVRPEIFSLGNRNVQGAALHPTTGELWEAEHGPKGGDEVNVIRAGRDYGWPTITYGKEYSGATIGEGLTAKAGMEQPVYYWDPVIATSGLAFYTGKAFPEWSGNLLVGGLGGKHLARLVLNGERVVGEERLLADRGKRIRDVRVGPDGFVYVVTDEDEGEVLRIRPR
jgi:glucose/arabinose dehydrogenase